MGSDRGGEEFFDAIGKRRTAKECSCGSDGHENAVFREESLAPQQTGRRGSGRSFEPNPGRDLEARWR